MNDNSVLTQASHQWRTRPSDQRFTSLLELNAATLHAKTYARGSVVPSRSLTAVPVDGDHNALVVRGPNGNHAQLTHWSFNQLAQRSGAPAGYLRNLPGPLAADCVNYGLISRDVDDVGVLLHKNGGPTELRAVTGPNYGRIWNHTITAALVARFGDGLTGDFRVPGEFGKAVPITKENTTLYASDRDMFVFLADEVRRIEIPNRRDGQSGSLARGFFVWNSEVGAQTFGIATFLFDYTCSNRIVWGAEQFREIKIRHTVSAPDRWVEEVAPALVAYAESSTDGLESAINVARAKMIGTQDRVDEFLKKRFTANQAKAISAAHMADEQRPIESLWDAATGITAYARGIQWQDERVTLEREAGKMLSLAI